MYKITQSLKHLSLLKNKTSKIISIFNENNSNPKIELNFVNEFTLLVAIILSAQTTDKMVNFVTKDIFDKYKTPIDFFQLGINNISNLIKRIGLYNSKAKNIFYLSEILMKQYDSKIPNNFNTLVSLPGVGRKTANVFLSVVHSEPVIAVDRHVHRVANRVGLVKSKNVLETEKQLMQIIPVNYVNKMHHWLVLHGRYVCKAQKPDCKNCKIKNFCDFDLKSI